MQCAKMWGTRALVAVAIVLLAVAAAGHLTSGVGAEPSGEERAATNAPVEGTGAAAQGELRAPHVPGSNKLEYALQRLEVWQEERGPSQALDFAESRGLRIWNGLVEVSVEQIWGETTDVIDLDAIRSLGCVVIAQSRHFLSVAAPFDKLTELSECGGVAFVCRRHVPAPYPPVEESAAEGDLGRAVVSEGVTKTNAASWHAAGLKGAGVKVAVIDMGFKGLAAAQGGADPELPPGLVTKNFVTTDTLGMDGTDVHGTLVAEYVIDMAPDVDLYLVRSASLAQDELAVNYCITSGIQIINCSTNYYGYQGDGAGPVCDLAETAADHGILWVNSAGNQGQDHNEGTITDANGNKWHEFAPGVETLEFSLPKDKGITVWLTWYDWPESWVNCDLYLYDSAGTRLDSSKTVQTTEHPGPPKEIVSYNASHPAGNYYVKIKKQGGSWNPDYDLHFSPTRGNLATSPYLVVSGSVLDPATTIYAVAVGAMDQSVWTTTRTIEPYSSQGPTQRTPPGHYNHKPDITGPDQCASSIAPGWEGTSAATPHVAGAAALVWSRWPAMTRTGVAVYLYVNVNMPLEPYDVFGYGQLHLPLPTPVEGLLYAVLTDSGTVRLRWTLSTLGGIEALNVYRGTSPEGPFARVNEEALPVSSPGSFEDTSTWPGTTFWYELRAVLPGGGEDTVIHDLASVTTGGKLALALHPAYPNPFIGETTMFFDVPGHVGPVSLGIYNASGQLVKRLVERAVERGRHPASWDGTDDLGRKLSAGVYFIRLEADGRQATRKVVVLR